MDLKIKDVAELLNISESAIRRLISDGKIPAYKIHHQFRFNRIEIEDWVMKQRQDSKDPETHHATPAQDHSDKKISHKGGIKQFSLYRAIHKGDVLHQVPGNTKEEVICATMKIIANQLELDADVLIDLLLDRENLMPTALNCGIGVPHTRDFLLKDHHDAVAVVFPEKPINYGALDGKPVHTLFFLFACEDKRHLHLLAKIAHLCSSSESLDFLQHKPKKELLLDYVRNWESQIQPS